MKHDEIAKELRNISNEILNCESGNEVRELLLQLRMYTGNYALKNVRYNYKYAAKKATTKEVLKRSKKNEKQF